ncbi:MAG: RNA polymerase sigma factor, partial [Gammaproteobacteria bacterium]
FIKAYRALPDFRGDARLSTWLYRITYLTAIDFKRHQARHLELADESQGEELADMSSASRSESTLEAGELQREIHAALNTLSPFEQTVFTLRHMQNFKLREIAQVVDRSEGTVKNILFRAIRKMRDQLAHTQFILQEMEGC